MFIEVNKKSALRPKGSKTSTQFDNETTFKKKLWTT